ncbi:hypothetical protein SSX86_030953 [Deinandra increscens subsp. villosa]|uniref:Gnk2-homologous domain-containing protein n=1 Tax=Deinandra increscens subsp. villosa TaxID=3103831 RepID=A0AAP0CAT6_9ASTR
MKSIFSLLFILQAIINDIDLAIAKTTYPDKHLTEQAAGGGDLRKYASGSAIYDGEENALYLAVQCTPDISKGDCIKCLSKASIEIHSCIQKTLFHGRVMSTNCYIRYSHIDFLRNPRDGYNFTSCY